MAMCFSNNMKNLITASDQGIIFIWRLPDGLAKILSKIKSDALKVQKDWARFPSVVQEADEEEEDAESTPQQKKQKEVFDVLNQISKASQIINNLEPKIVIQPDSKNVDGEEDDTNDEDVEEDPRVAYNRRRSMLLLDEDEEAQRADFVKKSTEKMFGVRKSISSLFKARQSVKKPEQQEPPLEVLDIKDDVKDILGKEETKEPEKKFVLGKDPVLQEETQTAKQAADKVGLFDEDLSKTADTDKQPRSAWGSQAEVSSEQGKPIDTRPTEKMVPDQVKVDADPKPINTQPTYTEAVQPIEPKPSLESIRT